jgi:dTDP-4-amino-4,6-dideoxygalactose transaminase
MKAILTKSQKRSNNFLPFSINKFDKEEIHEVVDSLESGWIAAGPKVRRFETEFAEYVGAAHAIAVNSATAGLHIALAAQKIGQGDEVITTPMTFCGTIQAIEYVGATPVFIDVDPVTANINTSQIEGAVTRRTKAILPIHYAGQPCDMDTIMDIAMRHGLFVIEDASHALGARYRGKKIGSIGNATVFSFHSANNMSTGEGGMIVTNDGVLADKMRMLTLHGISREVVLRDATAGSWYYEALELGFNYTMTDLQAAIGIWQLRKLTEMNQLRSEYARLYTQAFTSVPEIKTPYINMPSESRHAWQLYVIKVAEERLNINRSQFIDALKKEGVGTGVHYIPINHHPHYQKKYGLKPGNFPKAESWYRNCLSLPLYPAMTHENIEDVINAVQRIVEANRK